MQIQMKRLSALRVSQVLITSLLILSIYLIERNIRLKNQIEDMEWYQKIMLGSDGNIGYERVKLRTLVSGLNETGLPFDIVPNIVHYILFEVHEIEFAHFISMLSVLKNQRPELIYIHCDCHQLNGNYYQRALRVAKRTNTSIIVRYVKRPDQIFGHKLKGSWVNWHSSDIMRVKVLQEFGGIYLDRDVYVVQPLNVFFKYEMTLNWDEGQYLGTQTLVANKNSRFLHLWLETYRRYDPNLWYFAGEFATKHILYKRPDLVHRVKKQFGADGPEVCPKLYNIYYKDWKTEFYAIHLVIRGDEIKIAHWAFSKSKYPEIIKFNENVVKGLTNTFGEMTRILFEFENQLN